MKYAPTSTIRESVDGRDLRSACGRELRESRFQVCGFVVAAAVTQELSVRRQNVEVDAPELTARHDLERLGEQLLSFDVQALRRAHLGERDPRCRTREVVFRTDRLSCRERELLRLGDATVCQ
jgi:hypothetical protein